MALTRRQFLLIPFAVIAVFFLSAFHYSPGFDPISNSSSSSRSYSSHSFHSSSSRRPTYSPTKLISSNSGFNVFSSLYLRNGTVFLLSPPNAPPYDPIEGGGGGFKDRLGRELLPIKHILSTGNSLKTPESVRNPSSNDIQIIAWEDRHLIGLGERKVLVLDGTSWLVTDPGEFLSHYYHLWAEVLLGAWKALTIASNDGKNQFFSIPDPRRFIFAHSQDENHRDHAGLNGFILKSVFPALSYEYQMDWQERAKTDRTYMFEQVVIADRSAGSYGDRCRGPIKTYRKFMANVFGTEPNQDWIKPIRQRLLDVLPPAEPVDRPVVTYISRQSTGRALRPTDHEALIQSLEEAAERNGWILQVPTMEALPKDAQFELMARTTVLVGVHGNGLTHMMWMEPTRFSTVIEILADQGIFYDYALPAEALGHQHFAAWSDGEGKNTMLDTAVVHPPVNTVPTYHSKDIRVDGATVARTIEERLKGWKA